MVQKNYFFLALLIVGMIPYNSLGMLGSDFDGQEIGSLRTLVQEPRMQALEVFEQEIGSLRKPFLKSQNLLVHCANRRDVASYLFLIPKELVQIILKYNVFRFDETILNLYSQDQVMSGLAMSLFLKMVPIGKTKVFDRIEQEKWYKEYINEQSLEFISSYNHTLREKFQIIRVLSNVSSFSREAHWFNELVDGLFTQGCLDVKDMGTLQIRNIIGYGNTQDQVQDNLIKQLVASKVSKITLKKLPACNSGELQFSQKNNITWERLCSCFLISSSATFLQQVINKLENQAENSASLLQVLKNIQKNHPYVETIVFSLEEIEEIKKCLDVSDNWYIDRNFSYMNQ